MHRSLPLLFLLASCPRATPQPVAAPKVELPRIEVTSVDTRIDTQELMMGAVELQLSGEPLAEAMVRDLAGFDRFGLPPDRYQGKTDLAGFSTAVESYEYSKVHLNTLAFETGAGVSLAYGPLLNPKGKKGAEATTLVQEAVQQFGWAARATTLPMFDSGLGSNTNPVGWPGFWPILHPYRSFSPAIHPTNTISWNCTLSGDEQPTRSGTPRFEDYECDYNSLHLADRDAQVEKVITPGASGWMGWKQALWILNYLQLMHDLLGNPVTQVDEKELAQVGQANNPVRPLDKGAFRGVQLGSSAVEGFQAGFLITALDNQFEQWMRSLTTTDGKKLSGFPDLKAALRYDFESPLRWIPAAITVTETPDHVFPRPTAYAIQSAESHLIDQLGLLAAASTLYAVMDQTNPRLGGAQTARAWFDGHPFSGGPQQERALAMIRFLLVSIDRLHANAAGQLVDRRLPSGEQVPGIETSSVAYSIVVLRQTRRALTSRLELYTNNTPDSAGLPTALDPFPFKGAPGNATIAQRLDRLLRAQASLLMERTDATGRTDGDTLDAHTSAIRGLLSAYLATGDVRYRDRAVAVWERLDAVFFDPSAQLYSHVPQPATEVIYTPRRFGLLQGALRDLYLLVGSRPGREEMGKRIEQRLVRLNKLVLNGWNDRNQNEQVDYPDECIRVVDGLPRGGLQLAERALTGETGTLDNAHLDQRVITTDRERDCVPDMTAAQLPAVLAREIRLKINASPPSRPTAP